MLEILNINPFAEAMFYYWGKANGEDTNKNLIKLTRQFPSYKDALEKAAAPALALEKILDSKLRSDDALVEKFFKKIEADNGKTLSSLVGFCLASVMTNHLITSHPEFSPEELRSSLRAKKGKELIMSFCSNISTQYETTVKKEINEAELSKRLKALPVDAETKYLILDVIFNYKANLNDLLSLIMPAAKIIKGAKNVYQSAVEDFKELYSGDDAQARFESEFTSFPKLPVVESTKVAPTLFGLTTAFGRYNVDMDGKNKDAGEDIKYTSSTISAYIGVAKHIVGTHSQQDEITRLSESMKTLSDRKRLEMLFYLCSNRAYGQELCNEFELKQPTLSYHIQKLLDSDFVTVEFSGNKTYYTADKEGIRRMINAFMEKIK